MLISSFCHQGKRKEQEDRFRICKEFAGNKHLTLVYVCDGHGGHKAADFLTDRYETVFTEIIHRCDNYGNYTVLMAQALEQCVQEWHFKCFGTVQFKVDADKETFFAKRDNKKWAEEQLESGTTFCAVLIDIKERKLNIVNLGDSRAAWICNYNKLIGATVDHSVPLKMDPIPGFPFTYGDGYICDTLAMCRSFGDNDRKCTMIVRKDPDCLCVKLGNGPARLVVASDGFFDFVSNHGALYDEFADATALVKQIPEMDDNTTVIYVKIAGIDTEEPKVAPPACSKPRSKSPPKSKTQPVELKKKVTLKKRSEKEKRTEKPSEKKSESKAKPKPKKSESGNQSFEDMLASLHLGDVIEKEEENAEKAKKTTLKKPKSKKGTD